MPAQRAAVLNLTRFGDLLQSQPVIHGLCGQGFDVDLVCLENFSQAASLLDGVDRVVCLPGAKLLADLHKSWPQALVRLQAWQHEHFKALDLVLNMTPTPSASLLSSLMDGASRRGFSLDEDGFAVLSSGWAAYLQAATLNRGTSPLNLMDVFTRMAGFAPGTSTALQRPDADTVFRQRAFFENFGPRGCAGYFGLQLGASRDVRRWPVKNFVRLAEMVHAQFGLVPVLLGTAGERELGERFLRSCRVKCIDCMGKTDIRQLAATLVNVRFLVTNDTGTMHLAAGLGLPVAAIFLATAQPWDTGPGLEGALCLEPDLDCHPCGFGRVCSRDHACRWSVRPETMSACVARILDPGSAIRPEDMTGARVWRTSRDQGGFLDLVPLSGHENTWRTCWMRMQRHWYRQFLDESGAGPNPKCLKYPQAEELQRNLESLAGLLVVFREQMNMTARTGSSMFRAKALQTWERLQAMMIQDQWFPVLAGMWQNQANAAGADHAALQAMVQSWETLVRLWAEDLQT
jgi:ADP-heptose:LPS heptosyltransferase